ncbi:ATP-dependent helicase HrpB [Streptomyces sp. WAC05374]|uniref:ATP-dependent RNA helicase n=1 Tax=Streptomyces sp. WAC05374 TaxID=2487420 RepID=UPI000F875969|nr:ATP-dependent helicase C-terminal domain-containing protein [Streptomyces sp. WAC05374]RST07564.1 ATP-dependent helicase HrpB [Streptomyces sp. WAC05374]TDF48731.1 ATP-dependent helicase HrpB [Streptomyces sp. WAC05374]TDF55093.1 ATP-dependent helicase HrpB [Streptomyces sp. WAC05374]TDF55557.1 ATP-dependent helicase HrpB [Streptomyces sp. WAC05374]
MMRAEALELPVRAALPALEGALDEHGAAVLCAPPGTGKTTLVPLVLAERGARVLVAEPRRIAARAAARRMAWLLGERVGGRVGFTVRGERVVSRETVVEVVTTGVLLQRLQRDQELPGVDTVILDECHERHLDADTAAAFLLDVRAALRPELRLVAASATTDAEGWARLLGGAPVVEAPGTAHPVEVVWAPPAGSVRPPHGMSVDPALLAHVAAVVRRALAEREGDVLCFLQGVGEIARVAGLLSSVGAEVLQVHGRAPAAVQDAVLSPADGRRVVLATAVAESSLTVPGVRVVVDSGLAREPRVDHARGLGSLTTVRASRAAARQRAGRAGREAPGTVYRCWSEAEDGRLPSFPAPEIQVADLAAFALQAAAWGDPDAAGLALLDAPPAGAMAAARSVLAAVGAVDGAGRVTERGGRMARLGLHPRLARALLDGAPVVGARRAAEVVALLSEEPPREYGDDLSAAWRAARRGGDAYGARWRQEARRLVGQLEAAGAGGTGPGRAPAHAARRDGAAGGGGGTHDGTPGGRRGTHDEAVPGRAGTRHGTPGGGGDGTYDDAVTGFVAALAFPERVARARGEGAFLMASGTGAELGEGSRLRAAPWLAVAVADRPSHAASARVRLAAVVDEETAREAARHLLVAGEEVRWEDGDVVARSVERLGAVETAVRPLRDPEPALVREALLEGLRREGPALLRWSRESGELRQRLAFLHRVLGAPWPDVSDAALLERAREWLEPELSRARRRADLGRIDAGQALRRLLPWSTGEAARLEELAPERIEVPSGSRVRVEYGGEQPVLAVKLQEMFGLSETPSIAGVPVLVHLLSPAGRPAAVTADLASFWRDGYRSVRAELRGRYPRHPWPEDPATAEPTRRTNARR